MGVFTFLLSLHKAFRDREARVIFEKFGIDHLLLLLLFLSGGSVVIGGGLEAFDLDDLGAFDRLVH